MTGALWAVLHHCALCRRDMAGGRARIVYSLYPFVTGARGARTRNALRAHARMCRRGGYCFAATR